MNRTESKEAWGSNGKREGDNSTASTPVAGEIRLYRYDPAWPALFREEQMRIGKLFGALDPAIEHIGSTAVRGMSAKPIIDILIGFGNEQQRDDCEKVLAHHGYHYRPRFESVVAERRFFESDQAHWPANSLRFHLHVVNRGCQFWEDRIRFRDMLRRNQSVAGAYSRLKTQLSRKHTNDRRAYSDAKGGFVTSALQINQHESHDNAYQHSKFDEDTGISPLRRVQAKQKCRN